MRPSRRLLRLALGAAVLSVLTVSVAGIPDGAALAIWGALAAAMLTDLAISRGKRAVTPRLEAPAEVFAGETAHLSLELGEGAPALDARLGVPEGLGQPDTLTVPAGSGRFTVTAHRRGRFSLGPLWLTWPSRLALFEATPRYAVDAELSVVPNIRPVTSGEIDTAVRSDLYGIKENLLVGEGSEFHQLRDFTTGMDTRSIDWKHSARNRSLLAREMRAERNHQVVLAIDTGHLMREEIAGLAKLDHAVHASLATAWAAGIGGDLAGFYAYDAAPRLYQPPEPGRQAFARFRSRSADLAYESAESNPTLGLMHLAGLLNRRSLIVVFADFVDTTTAELLLENLAVLSRRHVLVFVALRDPALNTRQGPASLSEMAEAVATGEMGRERQIVLDRLARLGITIIDTEPAGLTPRLISAYITIKAREMI